MFELTVSELDQQIQSLLDAIQDDRESYEERVALAAPDDGLSTTERAIYALRRDERFPGDHAVARAWIENYAREVRLFRKKS